MINYFQKVVQSYCLLKEVLPECDLFYRNLDISY